MLTQEDRDILQKTAERALAFIFDHCDDNQFCGITALLVNGMREICDQEKQFQSEMMGLGGNVGSSNTAQQANSTPRPSRMNETTPLSMIGENRA